MSYLTEAPPTRGEPSIVAPGIRRIVAENPGPMTYHGTNTYLIDSADGTIVLDPGPDDAAHVAAILAAGGKISAILVSHTHHDHVSALPALRQATGAAVLSHAPSMTPDRALGHHDVFGDWTALHTPGHAPDHLCFARADGVVFTADHIMGWSSSVVSPPTGDMAAYFQSLRLMLARDDRLYLPGHGPPIADPGGYGRFLMAHRQGREDALLSALATSSKPIEDMVSELYPSIADRLRAAASRNVLAHLQKLQSEAKVSEAFGVWSLTAAA